MAQLRVGAATHTGMVRTENEDAFVTASPVFAVADGMGGHLAGEIASAMAVDTLRARLAGGPAVTDADMLVDAVRAANLAIFQGAHDTIERRGMGTTVTALAVLAPETPGGAERLALANVGDSRAYVLRNGVLQQLSVDHSYVQELVTTGQITKDEARHHPNRNIVTRALGIDPDVWVDAWTLPLIAGDRFLLCSDGLVDEVLDDAISDLLTGIDDAQKAADALVATANRHGGRDNTTVVVIDVQDGAEAPDDPLDIGLEPHWADGEGEVRAWRDDLRLDDTPPTATMRHQALAEPARTSTNAAFAPPAGDAAGTPVPVRPPRFTWRTLLFLTAVAAVFVAAFTMTAVYGRTGYFVGPDGPDVVVFKGRPDGVLWFDPTVEVQTGTKLADLTPADAAEVSDTIEFGSLDAAVAYVTGLEPAPTTTTPTTTTTPASTTTTATPPLTTTTPAAPATAAVPGTPTTLPTAAPASAAGG